MIIWQTTEEIKIKGSICSTTDETLIIEMAFLYSTDVVKTDY